MAEHVGSRTQDECILHFLRLPIEDAYLEGDFGSHHPSGGAAIASLADAAHPMPPFSKTGNPILSTVAFLASVVDPRVAASAASAALKSYAAMRDEVPAGLLHEHKARVEAAVRMGREVDPTRFGLEELGIVKTGDAKRTAETASVVDKAAKESGVQEEEEEKDDASENAKPKSEGTDDQDVERIKMDTREAGKAGEPMTTADEKTAEAGADSREEEDRKPSGGGGTNSLPPNPDSLGTAAACALAAAATKARHLASVEEKRIKGLVAQLVETQLKKLDIKLKQFQVSFPCVLGLRSV